MPNDSYEGDCFDCFNQIKHMYFDVHWLCSTVRRQHIHSHVIVNEWCWHFDVSIESSFILRNERLEQLFQAPLAKRHLAADSSTGRSCCLSSTNKLKFHSFIHSFHVFIHFLFCFVFFSFLSFKQNPIQCLTRAATHQITYTPVETA